MCLLPCTSLDINIYSYTAQPKPPLSPFKLFILHTKKRDKLGPSKGMWYVRREERRNLKKKEWLPNLHVSSAIIFLPPSNNVPYQIAPDSFPLSSNSVHIAPISFTSELVDLCERPIVSSIDIRFASHD